MSSSSEAAPSLSPVDEAALTERRIQLMDDRKVSARVLSRLTLTLGGVDLATEKSVPFGAASLVLGLLVERKFSAGGELGGPLCFVAFLMGFGPLAKAYADKKSLSGAGAFQLALRAGVALMAIVAWFCERRLAQLDKVRREARKRRAA